MRLFDIDSYIKEFDATVISAEEKENFYLIELDKTAFFPEGGGQKSDKGFLNDVEVFDVQEKDGRIFHYTRSPLEISTAVHGVLNWKERFYKMQNHTAEHIISGLVYKKFGYDNTGFHLGDDYVTLDFNGPISQKEIEEIELLANETASESHPIKAWYPEDPLKFSYRSKLDLKENVRLVEIENVDLCACCAPHVKNTSEVGMIKVISMEKYKGGVRILLKSGLFAFKTLDLYQKTLKNISSLLSLPPEETFSGVKKLMDKISELNYENNGLKKELLKNSLKEHSLPYIFVDSPDLLKDAVNILSKNHSFCGAFSGNDTDGYRFMIFTLDIDKTRVQLKEKLNASGGGRDNMIQGLLKAEKSSIENFFIANS